MNNKIQVLKKETPPIAVRDLDHELKTLAVLVEQWSNCTSVRSGNKVFREITARLRPNLMKALIMIAQKQTGSILKNRTKVTLTNLGRVRIHSAAIKHFLQWLDVLVAEDGTPFLRRVAVSPDGIDFYAITWAGCAAIRCVNTDRWDSERNVWAWDSADGDAATELLRDGVLPYIPLRMEKNETVSVSEWNRHLEFVSANGLMQAVDRFGEGGLHEIEQAEVMKLLEGANADLNPLWSHLLREAEWD